MQELQFERQKWLHSLEEKNVAVGKMEGDIPSKQSGNHMSQGNGRYHRINTAASVQDEFSIDSFQIDPLHYNFVSPNLRNRISNDHSSDSSKNRFKNDKSDRKDNIDMWERLLGQYKDEVARLNAEMKTLKTHNDKLIEEKDQILTALKDQQAKSQFRIAQVGKRILHTYCTFTQSNTNNCFRFFNVKTRSF